MCSLRAPGQGALGIPTMDSSESDSRTQVDATGDLELELDTVHKEPESESMIIDPEPTTDNNPRSSNAGIH